MPIDEFIGLSHICRNPVGVARVLAPIPKVAEYSNLGLCDARASVVLGQPQGLVLKNGSSGQLVASVSPVKNTNMYEGRAKGPTGDWLPSVFTGDSQHISFDGLTAGTMYTVEVRALGGATGESNWSDPSSHMAM